MVKTTHINGEAESSMRADLENDSEDRAREGK
jgi:hypothetical protein